MPYKCRKCKQTFKSKKYLDTHKKNSIPCDFVCKICKQKKGCRRSYYYHMENYHAQIVDDAENFEGSEDSETALVNNVVANPISSNNTNTNNNTNANNNSNTLINDVKNNNIVMMHPLGLTYHYMNRNEVVMPVNGRILDLVRDEQYREAYIALFEQIHGNPKLPEYHNVYVKEKGKNEAYVFHSKGFECMDFKLISNDMYDRLKSEMRWSVSKSNADDEEKDQLMWNIQLDWMNTKQVDADELMEQVFYNNKSVVENTFKKNKVYSDLKYIALANKCRVEDVLYDTSKPWKLPK